MLKLLLSVVLLLVPMESHSATTGTARFLGNILAVCDVSNFVDGTVVANSGSTQLSSSAAGGTPATFTVVTTGIGYKITQGTPTLTGPSGTVSGVTFTTTTQSTGTSLLGVTIPLINAVGSLLNLNLAGTYAVTVNATASLATGSFEAGAYTLTVPVSCSL